MKQSLFNYYFCFSLRKWATCFFALAPFICPKAQTNHLSQSADTPISQFPNLPISTSHVTIRKIHVEGNRRTKADIILRELDFVENDTISLATLTARLQENELNVLNTGLFTAANFSFKEWVGSTNEVGLLITVREGWYIFPFPILEMADRNFNIWWDTYDHDLSRLNWGIRFYHTNLSGRRDQLKAVVQQGFTKKYELIYTMPYLNRHKRLGANVNFLHTRERQIGYSTLGNELLFTNDRDRLLLQRLRIGAGLQYRRKLDITHHLNLSFHDNLIDETVRSELNPDFFLDGLAQRYLAASYQITVDKRDIRPYPMHGHLVDASISRNGLFIHDGMDALNLQASFQQFFSFGKKWSAGFVVKGKTELHRNRQPYYGSQALGYEPDFIRGYEYYVVDGTDYAYNKSLVRYRLFDRKLNLGPYMRLESFREMPVKLFLVFHNELGYANNPFYAANNSLANELLWGTTLGLDLVVYYDKVFNFEVSRNRLGEVGFYLHWTFSF
ncbi:MAG: BamA/TamA family outer membrane protein [Saprospiraceae bacterium]|nr:BamA/TamA family outer membrane protein [Saprospiraceae bacterium]